MCGIAGIYRKTGPVVDEDLGRVAAMAKAIEHRGPVAGTIQQ